jgi:hypothetical protein
MMKFEFIIDRPPHHRLPPTIILHVVNEQAIEM